MLKVFGFDTINKESCTYVCQIQCSGVCHGNCDIDNCNMNCTGYNCTSNTCSTLWLSK